MNLWVDDPRTPPDGWVWATTSDEAIARLSEYDVVPCPSITTSAGTTPRSVVPWMYAHESWPSGEIRVHSANPVGAEWLTGPIDRFRP
ncbi:cyclic-phosphate processing receiver domain-containing protein [Gordonia sp. C13]|uniref:cyclic-phosphate processing receiver domain-containing protein n=1 Tax=Gordonia sp. C13 TaxID=2935078 RepID=UPI00200B72C6|nr:cyclic-phosphate processing receiver domain-containing protein [Gordonia sp. C13]MCK8616212.1 hypothetical protein [Gordonia sp. C13]